MYKYVEVFTLHVVYFGIYVPRALLGVVMLNGSSACYDFLSVGCVVLVLLNGYIAIKRGATPNLTQLGYCGAATMKILKK